MRRSRPVLSQLACTLVFRRALWLTAFGLSLWIWGCSGSQNETLPFAQSAASSGLVLNIHTTTEHAIKASSHAAAAPIHSVARELSFQIGETNAPDVVKPSPFPISGSSGQVLECTIGNIPPGLKKRVEYWAKDASANVVDNGVFFLDFLPGQLTSNDLNLRGGGGGSSRPSSILYVTEFQGRRLVQVNTGTGAMTPIFSSFPSGVSPHSVYVESGGDFIVTEFGTSGNLVRIKPDGTRSVICSRITNARGVTTDGAGNYVVAAGQTLVSITPAGVMSLIYSFMSGEGTPLAVTRLASGNYLVTEQAFPSRDAVSEITPTGARTVLVDYSSMGLGPGVIPTGVAPQSDGTLIVGEGGLKTLSRVTPGILPVRTVLFDLSTTMPGEVLANPADPAGGVVVTTRNDDRLLWVSSTGNQSAVLATFPTGASPLGIGRLP